MKVDPTDIAIIRHLRDGRKSFGKIAGELEVSENTVRSRVNRLMEEGVLTITGLIDPEAFPSHTIVYVGIKLLQTNLVDKAREISNLKGVINVSVVTGRYDLMAVVLLKEDFGLLEFFTQEASRIKGLASTESFVVYKGFNLHVPYIM